MVVRPLRRRCTIQQCSDSPSSAERQRGRLIEGFELAEKVKAYFDAVNRRDFGTAVEVSRIMENSRCLQTKTASVSDYLLSCH